MPSGGQPVARILGESVRTVRPGEKIILDASSSFDPDKNSLSYLGGGLIVGDQFIFFCTLADPVPFTVMPFLDAQ